MDMHHFGMKHLISTMPRIIVYRDVTRHQVLVLKVMAFQRLGKQTPIKNITQLYGKKHLKSTNA